MADFFLITQPSGYERLAMTLLFPSFNLGLVMSIYDHGVNGGSLKGPTMAIMAI